MEGVADKSWNELTFETGQSGLIGKGMYKQGLRRLWEIDYGDMQGKYISGQGNSQCKDPNTESILECSWHSDETKSSETREAEAGVEKRSRKGGANTESILECSWIGKEVPILQDLVIIARTLTFFFRL